MRPYEVMIILDPSLEESAIQAQVDRATELIRSGGAEPGRVDRWGKRRLAYEILHHREGTYLLVEARGEPGSLDALDRALHLADEVLRHKVVRLPDHPTKRVPRPPSDFAAAEVASDIATDEVASDIATDEVADDIATDEVADDIATDEVAGDFATDEVAGATVSTAGDSATSTNGA